MAIETAVSVKPIGLFVTSFVAGEGAGKMPLLRLQSAHASTTIVGVNGLVIKPFSDAEEFSGSQTSSSEVKTL